MRLKPTLFLLPVLLLAACRSTQEAEYVSVAALMKSQYFTLIPKWLPPNAEAIKLKEDKSTHEIILRFEFSRPQIFSPPAPNCHQVKRPFRINPPMGASWWPSDIESPIASYLELIYDCGAEGILLMRGLPEKTTAYFWR